MALLRKIPGTTHILKVRQAARLKLAPSIVVVSDGAAGNEVQALAVAAQLSQAAPRVWRVRARWPWSLLAPQWAPVLRPQQWQPALLEPWPDLAVGAGRVGAAALLTFKQASAGHTRTVQILDPRIAPARFDLLIAPAHDQLLGSNVIAIEGSLNAIDAAWLARERLAHVPLRRLAGPRTVVLVGGRHRSVGLGDASFAYLAAVLANWRKRDGGSVLLLGSRRTPLAWQKRLRAQLPDVELRWFGPQDGENPYRGALAWGDRFIVSADSVNMQSEALATARPVYSWCDGVPSGKLGRFHRSLVESGRLRPLGATAATWDYPPLRELARIAPQLRARLDL